MNTSGGRRAATRRGARLALPALLALLAGCSTLAPQPHADVRQELARNRALWRAQGIGSYEYVVRRICFCPPPIVTPVLVRVREGRVAERVYAGGGTPDPQHASSWPAVEGLFDTIDEAIRRDAHAISVDYHPRMGYPTRIQIDYRANVADEEQGFTAGELVPHR